MTEFSPHIYFDQISDDDSDYKKHLRALANPLIQNQVPVLFTMGHLAHSAGVPYQYINKVVSRTVDPYKVFPIKKRSGGKRYICAPEPILQQMQRWIHDHILYSKGSLCSIAGQATAFLPDTNHCVNANRHLGAKWLIKIDIQDFFESISERQVYRVFRSFGYSSLVSLGLTRVCTRALHWQDRRLTKKVKRWQSKTEYKFSNEFTVGYLPQGAPTSPVLANLVCRELDKNLSDLAAGSFLTYSRYADDMVFSGDFADRGEAIEFLNRAIRVVTKQGFRINRLKTGIRKEGSRRVVTGLLVDGDKVRVPKQYKDQIKQELYYLEKFGVDDHCRRLSEKISQKYSKPATPKNKIAYLLRLSGKIRYVEFIEPQNNTVIGFRETFNRLFPTVSQLEPYIQGRYLHEQ